MNNGWIKLHRQLLKNKIFRHDPTAWHVFEVLLLIVDSKTAEWSGGRFMLADLCENKPGTNYKALLRLEKAKMVTLSSNNRYTIIHICNWSKYQSNDNNASNNTVTTQEQLGNTITRNKNKNKNTTNVVAKAYGNPEINEMFNYWATTTGVPISGKAQANRRACHNLINKHGVPALKKLVGGVAAAQADQYAPRIVDFVSLQAKLSDLLVWGKKKNKSNGGITVIS